MKQYGPDTQHHRLETSRGWRTYRKPGTLPVPVPAVLILQVCIRNWNFFFTFARCSYHTVMNTIPETFLYLWPMFWSYRYEYNIWNFYLFWSHRYDYNICNFTCIRVWCSDPKELDLIPGTLPVNVPVFLISQVKKQYLEL